MRLRVEATPEELQHRGVELVEALADRLGVPADFVSKAEGEHSKKPPRLRHGVLRELHDRERDLFRRTYATMVEEIAAVLSSSTSY